MAGTVRTLSALDALLADNVAGDISAQDVRDFLWSAMLSPSASSADAAVSAAAGTHYKLNIGAFTANRNFTLPASAPSGARIRVTLTAGDDTYALILIGDTGVSINGGTAATEWSRLSIDGDTIEFESDGANNWDVVSDSRTRSLGRLPTDTLVSSEHLGDTLADFGTVTDRLYYTPFLYTAANDIDEFVLLFDTVGTATVVRVGLYTNKNGLPGDLVVQTGDMTPVAETAVGATITQRSLRPGWHFLAVAGNGSYQLRKSPYSLSPLGVRTGQTFATHYGLCYENLSSTWETSGGLPSSAGSVTVDISQPPKILVRVV